MAKGGFRGGPMGGMNQAAMMKQVQKMQQEMMRAQQELEERKIEATSGGGAVTVKISGKKELTGITISPEVVDPDDIDMLQDLIIAAVNEAMRKADEESSREMSKLTGGLNIPGLF